MAASQLSLASWLLSHPSMAPFAKTVVGHRAQLFGQITVEGDPDPPDPALCALLLSSFFSPDMGGCKS